MTRPAFRRPRVERGLPWSLWLVLGVVTVGLAVRAWWPLPARAPALVTVEGEVPHPGTYPLTEATVVHAVLAAGGERPPGRDVLVPPGHTVRVLEDGSTRLRPPSDPLLVALPVDVNRASEVQLDALPGVSTSTAARLVRWREAHGGFRSDQELERVVGTAAYARLQPFIERSPVGRVSVNEADADALRTLPGIGPTLAERIVRERAEGGDFSDLDDLQRVNGVGPALVRKLEPLVLVR